MFVRTKHKIDKSHEFALVVVNNDVTWVCLAFARRVSQHSGPPSAPPLAPSLPRPVRNGAAQLPARRHSSAKASQAAPPRTRAVRLRLAPHVALSPDAPCLASASLVS